MNNIVNNEEMLKIQKREEYMAYIDEHINNVKKAFKLFSSIDWRNNPEIQEAIKETIVEIESHDSSKYSEEEFEYYRMHFYPINDEEKKISEEMFDKAWKHHYLNNPHHWNYWVKDDIATDMDLSSIIHMIADWQGMSFKFGGTCKSWYYENKHEINLSTNTEIILEQLLDIYESYINGIEQ